MNHGDGSEIYSTICLLETFTVLSSSCSVVFALIEARKQWQINGVGREVVDFRQRGLWKPFVSWAVEIRSEKTLSVLNLRLLISESTLKGPYIYIRMFLLPGRGYLIHFRERRSFPDYTEQGMRQVFLVACLELNSSPWLESCLPYCFLGKVTEQCSLRDKRRV